MTAPAAAPDFAAAPWAGADIAPLPRQRVRGRSAGGPVDLREGVEFLLDGEPRKVVKESVRTVDGLPVMALVRPDSVTELVPLRDLLFRRTVRPVGHVADHGSAYPAKGGQQPEVGDLDAVQLRRLQLRLAHALEAHTGYRSGDPWTALPGEPKPQYDPALVPHAKDRRQNKVAELKAAAEALDPDSAREVGIGRLSARTLQRTWYAWQDHRALAAVMDRRLVRPRTGRKVDDALRSAIFEVEDDFPPRLSRVSVATKYRRLNHVLRANGVPEEDIPVYETYRSILKDWFGPTGARQKYRRTQDALPAQGAPVIAHRPGQVVFLDTNSWDVLVRDGLFGLPSRASLTLAMDVYTRSIVGYRFTLVADKSVDVAMVIRDVMMPMPMRPEWTGDAEWPYPGVPAHVVAEAAGHEVAGKPFMPIETVTTDHGSVYASHHVAALAEECGTNFLPARRMRARDKHVVEVAFKSIRQLLLEELPGYRGMDVADRGADPEGDASMTIEEAEKYLAWFVVNVWQKRALGEHKPSWAPDGPQSPNSLFAMSMAQAGWSMQIPEPDLYYRLLDSYHVQVFERGVKVKGLWYRHDALDAFLLPSTRGGRKGGKYVVKWDPRDRRTVFFQHPETLEWLHLRWTGLGADDAFPSFSDATAKAVLQVARDRRIKPLSDRDLLPLFSEFYAKVDAEHGAGHRRTGQRRAAAREQAQARAAAADQQHAVAPVATTVPVTTAHDEGDGTVVAFDSSRAAARAVDRDRQHAREADRPTAPRIPLSLRDARRRANRDEDDQ